MSREHLTSLYGAVYDGPCVLLCAAAWGRLCRTHGTTRPGDRNYHASSEQPVALVPPEPAHDLPPVPARWVDGGAEFRGRWCGLALFVTP